MSSKPRIKRIVLEEIPLKRKPLGRHVEHDPRSRTFAITPKKSTVIKTVRHTLYGPVLNQLKLGSCTGNATCGALNTRGSHKPSTKLYKEQDAIDVYSLATTLDGFSGSYPPDDTGSSGLAAAKAAQQRGMITEYRHAFSTADALAALMDRAVITGVNWYEGFDRPDVYGRIKIEGQVRGGHEFCINGYDVTTKLLQGIQSWGPSYGRNGRFYLSLEDWDRLLGENGDCTILIV